MPEQQTHSLALVRDAVDESQQAFAVSLGLSIRCVSGCETRALSDSWKLINALASRFALSLDTARAICNGTISESDLQTVLKQITKAKAKSGGK